MKTILFRVDGGIHQDIGTGHIARSILLANRLKERYKIEFISLNEDGFEYGHEKIKNAGFSLKLIASIEYLNNLKSLIREISPSFIICDLYQYNDKELYVLRAEKKIPLLTFDHFEDHKNLSKYPINAVVAEANNYFEGLNYIILPEFNYQSILFSIEVKQIFVCFGGFDFLDLTFRTIKSLLKVNLTINVVIVVGSIYDKQKIYNKFGTNFPKNVSILSQPKDFNSLIAESQVAIVSGGLTLFQCLAAGVASIVMCQYEHQLITMKDFERYQAFFNLGIGNNVLISKLEEKLFSLIDDAESRAVLFNNARGIVDGLGLDRCLRLIEDEIEE